jgi:hypothetical protein
LFSLGINAVKRRVEPKRKKGFTLNILEWLFGIGIPLLFTYLGIVSYFPKLSLAFLEPLDKKDALSAPVELANEGLFAVRNVRFTWMPKNVLYAQGSRVSGFGEFRAADGQAIQALNPGEKATVKSVLPLFFDAPVKSADLQITVSYQPRLFPFTFRKVFRFGTATDSDGFVRWFHRPVNE